MLLLVAALLEKGACRRGDRVGFGHLAFKALDRRIVVVAGVGLELPLQSFERLLLRLESRHPLRQRGRLRFELFQVAIVYKGILHLQQVGPRGHGFAQWRRRDGDGSFDGRVKRQDARVDDRAAAGNYQQTGRQKPGRRKPCGRAGNP